MPEIVSLYQSYVSGLEGIGSHGEHSGHCPFHDDANPSFSVDLGSGLWTCHAGCGSGDAANFAERVGLDPKPFYLNRNRSNVSTPRILPNQPAENPLPAAEVERARNSYARLGRRIG